MAQKYALPICICTLEFTVVLSGYRTLSPTVCRYVFRLFPCITRHSEIAVQVKD